MVFEGVRVCDSLLSLIEQQPLIKTEPNELQVICGEEYYLLVLLLFRILPLEQWYIIFLVKDCESLSLQVSIKCFYACVFKVCFFLAQHFSIMLGFRRQGAHLTAVRAEAQEKGTICRKAPKAV